MPIVKPITSYLLSSCKSVKNTFLLPLLVLAISFVGCQQTELTATEPVNVTVAGATAMQPVLVALTAAFNQQHPQVFFDIIGGDSTTGEERVRTGQVQLAASTLISPTVPSFLNAVDSRQQLVRTPLGLDGLVIIVNQRNPIDNLTLLQLQELYSGRTWNWQTLTDIDLMVANADEDEGADGTVLLVAREDGSGSRKLFDERVMGSVPLALTAVVMPTSGDVVDYVAQHPAAIGYVSRAYVMEQLSLFDDTIADDPVTDENQPSVSENNPSPESTTSVPIRLVAVEGKLPTTEALRSQSYFLIQPLYLVSNGQPRGWPRQFIDFALSPAGQAIVARYHLPIR